MADIQPAQIEAGLAYIRRQRAHHEELMRLEAEEQQLLGLHVGPTRVHFPTPGSLLQTTERPTLTPGRHRGTIDLTMTPKQEVKEQEESDDRVDSPTLPETHQESSQPEFFLPDQCNVPLESCGSQQSTHQQDPLSAGNGVQNALRAYQRPGDEQATVPNPDQDPLGGRPRRERKRVRALSSEPSSPKIADFVQKGDNAGARRRGPAKKRRHSHADFVNAVEDEEYRTIIKTPGGGEGLVDVVCKFCETNSSTNSGHTHFFKGLGAFRGHVSQCHRNEVPMHTKFSTKFVLQSCLKMTTLTPEQEHAVLNHQHAAFSVAKRVGNVKKKGKQHRTPEPAQGEVEAQREIYQAFAGAD